MIHVKQSHALFCLIIFPFPSFDTIIAMENALVSETFVYINTEKDFDSIYPTVALSVPRFVVHAYRWILIIHEVRCYFNCLYCLIY